MRYVDGHDRGPLGSTLSERMAASRKWAAWAPGMKKAMVVALEVFIGNGMVRKLTADQWQARLANDHLPFYQGCKTCLTAAGKSRYHTKVVDRDSFTLAVDLRTRRGQR